MDVRSSILAASAASKVRSGQAHLLKRAFRQSD
jgi:hypothetical protein